MVLPLAIRGFGERGPGPVGHTVTLVLVSCACPPVVAGDRRADGVGFLARAAGRAEQVAMAHRERGGSRGEVERFGAVVGVAPAGVPTTQKAKPAPSRPETVPDTLAA